jgi:amidase
LIARTKEPALTDLPRHDQPPAADPGPVPAPAPVALPDLLALSASELSSAMARGAVSAAELMRVTLDHIDAVNPTFNAIVSLKDRAALLREAGEADTARASGQSRGWLHGIPIAIKDLAAAEGFPTTQGSPLYAKDGNSTADCLMVARLRGAGAIVIGKTNTPEFGLGSHSFNPVFGATRNAWDPSKSAGGSSGGAGAALALRMVSVADGSDMMGSLRNPAGWNAVWGMRPSAGRVPNNQSPDVFLHQLSTDGPLARTVEDLARLLETQSGPAPGAAPLALPAMKPGVASRLDAGTFEGKRIGWLGDWGGRMALEPEMHALCRAALSRMEAMGARVAPLVPDIDPETVWRAWIDLRSWAVAAKLGPVLADPTTRDLLKPEAVWEIERGLAMSAMDVHRATVMRSDWHRAMTALEQDFDAIALPVAQLFAFPVEWRWPGQIAGRAMDTYHRWMECVVPASLSGRPAISLPAGFSSAGLPGGIQLIGQFNGDEALLGLGRAWERALSPEDRALPPALRG